MSVLVTGATGSIGRRVVSGLLDAGEGVRALTRKPADAGLDSRVDVVEGDLTAADVPSGCFEGVRQLFLFPALGGVAPFVAAAAEAGVEHVVVLSSLAAAGGPQTGRGALRGGAHPRLQEQGAETRGASTGPPPRPVDAQLPFLA